MSRAFALPSFLPGNSRFGSDPEKRRRAQQAVGLMERAPHERPPFTLGQLKRAIPPHCFERSLRRSSSYLAMDLAMAAALFYMASQWATRSSSSCCFAAMALWPIYWAAQGCVLTGLWVIAHECGHHAFSEYSLVDDAIGLALHSLLLVPYFSWKYSHRRHHSNTGSLDRDEVFVPKKKKKKKKRMPTMTKPQEEEELSSMHSMVYNPAGRLLSILIRLTVGWPAYLLFNASGRRYPRSIVNHFDPNSPIFGARERPFVLLSDAALIACISLLCRLARSHGMPWLLGLYIAPVLVANAFLVLITFLQHTHPALPRYSRREWEWLRGALSTVDRDFGPALNRLFHHIADAHVVHHLFPSIPHYHAREASDAIEPILGEYYRLDSTPVLAALWRDVGACVLVEPHSPDDDDDDSGIFWYTNQL